MHWIYSLFGKNCHLTNIIFVVVQSLSCVRLFVTSWTAARQAFLSFTISLSLLKLMSIELMMPSNNLILCCPLLLPPSIFPNIRVFSNELSLPIRWPKYWIFHFSISPSNEYSGLISFKMDQLDLLAVQGTLKSLLQHHSLKASILWCSASFMVQLTSIHDHWKNHSFDYMDLCEQSAVSTFENAVYVCHNFFSKKQVSFNFMPAVTICSDFGAQENKVCHCFHCFPICLPWSDGTGCHHLHFLSVEFLASFFHSPFHFYQEALQFLFAFCH